MTRVGHSVSRTLCHVPCHRPSAPTSRTPTRQFASQRAAVEAAGYEAGEGFIKLPYDRELPVPLLEQLIAARREEFEATGAGW